MKKFAFIAAFIIAVFQVSFCQINPEKVKITTTELSNGLYIIKLYGGNCLASIGNDGILLVDASYSELGNKLKSEIQKIDNRPIKYLVNTHWHFDHTGGNLAIGKEAIIIAHDSTRALLSKDKILLGEKMKAHPLNILPQLSFSTELNIYFNADTIQLIAMPGGHTNGDILVYFKKSKILHIGDIIFSDMFPFCDVENGGKVLRMSENIQKIISLFPTDIRIIPGHGREYNVNNLRNYKKMIDTTYEIVMKEIKKNKNLNEIKNANVLINWKDWGISFSCNDWIEMIYNSIKQQKN